MIYEKTVTVSIKWKQYKKRNDGSPNEVRE